MDVLLQRNQLLPYIWITVNLYTLHFHDWGIQNLIQYSFLSFTFYLLEIYKTHKNTKRKPIIVYLVKTIRKQIYIDCHGIVIAIHDFTRSWIYCVDFMRKVSLKNILWFCYHPVMFYVWWGLRFDPLFDRYIILSLPNIYLCLNCSSE